MSKDDLDNRIYVQTCAAMDDKLADWKEIFVSEKECTSKRGKIVGFGSVIGAVGIAIGWIVGASAFLAVAVFPADYELGGMRNNDGAFYNASLHAHRIFSPSYKPHVLGKTKLNAFIPVDFDLDINGSEQNSRYTATLKATEYIGRYKSKNMVIHEYNSELGLSRTSLEKTFEYTIKRGILEFNPSVSVFLIDRSLDASIGLMALYDADPYKLQFDFRITEDESFFKYQLYSDEFGISCERQIFGDLESYTSKVFLKGKI